MENKMNSEQLKEYLLNPSAQENDKNVETKEPIVFQFEKYYDGTAEKE